MEVKIKTNEYRQENNPIMTWLNENVIEEENSVLHLGDVCLLCFEKEISKKEKNKVRREVEKWITKEHPSIDPTYKDSRNNNIKYRGWKGLAIKRELDE